MWNLASSYAVRIQILSIIVKVGESTKYIWQIDMTLYPFNCNFYFRWIYDLELRECEHTYLVD